VTTFYKYDLENVDREHCFSKNYFCRDSPLTKITELKELMIIKFMKIHKNCKITAMSEAERTLKNTSPAPSSYMWGGMA
jgi:hypothetical protein